MKNGLDKPIGSFRFISFLFLTIAAVLFGAMPTASSTTSQKVDPFNSLGLFAPPKVVLIAPNSSTDVVTNVVAFEWRPAAGATWYQLWVGTNSTIATINLWYSVAQCACYNDHCAVQPDAQLARGSYQWYIRAYSDSGGYGEWSDGMSFDVTPPPGKPTLVSPSGKIIENNITFTWNAVADAPSYWIEVFLNGSDYYNLGLPAAQVHCASGSGTCYFTPGESFIKGTYQWHVQGYFIRANGSKIAGPWSDQWTFNTEGYSAQIISLWPVEKAKPNSTAVLWAQVKNIQAYDAQTYTGVWFEVEGPGMNKSWVGSVDLGGLGAQATQWYSFPWQVPSNAQAGNYTYYAQAWKGTTEKSALSSPQAFVVGEGAPPGKAVLISPSSNSTVATTTPTYKWNAVPGSTWYLLFVSDSAVSKKIQQWYTAADAGCASGTGTCSITPSVSLAKGACMWWIQTWNDAGGPGPWSDGMSFTVGSKTSGPLGIEFADIAPGSFMMGSDVCSWCKPIHKVTLTKAFQIGKYEITQGQWTAAMGNNPSNFKGDNSLPLENATYTVVQQFLAKLNALNDGYLYRLPTEAEWEYACRAGTTTDRYGNLDDIAWYSQTSGGKTHIVGTKQPNAWGLYDTLGNVAEWVQDWYDKSYYTYSPSTDPQGPATGTTKVWRGGSFAIYPDSCTASMRGNMGTEAQVNTIGFRVVRVPR